MRYGLLIATLLLFTLGCEKVGSKVGLQATTQASPSSPGLPEKQERQIAEEERKAQAEEKARKIREKLGAGLKLKSAIKFRVSENFRPYIATVSDTNSAMSGCLLTAKLAP